jgi:hypothetical protein
MIKQGKILFSQATVLVYCCRSEAQIRKIFKKTEHTKRSIKKVGEYRSSTTVMLHYSTEYMGSGVDPALLFWSVSNLPNCVAEPETQEP